MKVRAYVLMLFVVCVWGSTFVLIKDALQDATPLAFNLVRMTLAFLVLAIAYRKHWHEITRGKLLAGAVVGFFLAGGYQFQTAGLVKTTPSKSAFITGLVVVLVPLFSAIPGIRPQDASLLPDFASINIGDLLTLGCAIAFAFHCISLGHASPRINFQPLALLQIGFCALFMAISMPLLEHPHLNLTPRLWIALGISSVLATAAAFSIQSWAQSILPATHTALLMTMEPVFAWITSFLFMGERLGLRPASGAVLILIGISLTELVPLPHVPTAHEA